MKKRILSTILMAAMVLSMAGCGGNTDTPAATEGGEVTTTTTAKEEVAETTTTVPETEATTTTTEAPKETPKITSEPKIYNDCMVFEADGKNYVYNITDKAMYEYEGEGGIGDSIGNIIRTDDKIYNLKTKELYDVKMHSVNLYDYNPVYKVEESFDGDTYYFGIIDKNGEWVLPMSSDYAICEYKFTGDLYGVSSSLVNFDNGSFKALYDWKNNKVITPQELGKTSIADVDGNVALICDWVMNPSNISSYNIATGESNYVYDKECTLKVIDSGKTSIVDYGSEYIAVLGDNFEKLYEITGYEARSVFDANENYVVFPSKGADGGNYIIILDKDGNRVVEPISYKASTGSIVGDYVISGSLATPVEKIVNCKTGEIIDYECEQFSASTGMMAVKSDGAYYLAHVSDPDTLINPFEIAE